MQEVRRFARLCEVIVGPGEPLQILATLGVPELFRESPTFLRAKSQRICARMPMCWHQGRERVQRPVSVGYAMQLSLIGRIERSVRDVIEEGSFPFKGDTHDTLSALGRNGRPYHWARQPTIT